MTKLISNCCSSPDMEVAHKDVCYSELGICPKCKEHCEFIKDDVSSLDREFSQEQERIISTLKEGE